MNWWQRLWHRCPQPDIPVMEDQRLWVCSECGATWEWTLVDFDWGDRTVWVKQ